MGLTRGQEPRKGKGQPFFSLPASSVLLVLSHTDREIDLRTSPSAAPTEPATETRPDAHSQSQTRLSTSWPVW
ncbi:hypothetical protein BN1723_002337 [Verticillium longisporum]|uniref:Uncharacterized protein n=1 Tax=Verticillium longisporum TaxID=100787 RepID=A0A0G4L5A0_VERLO|nr:hypothetical protein BN1723_002337 [Verticillium longisporum]